jgi:hypothetical protein
MPSRAASNVQHRHPFQDDVVKKLDLRTQESADLRRLRGRI